MREEIIAILETHLNATDEWGGAKLAGWRYGGNVVVEGIDEATDEIMVLVDRMYEMTKKLCIDCGQQIGPDFAKIENVERCVECTVIAFWQFIKSTQDDLDALDKLDALDALDKLTLCPDCGEPWLETETIRADGSLGCSCQESETAAGTGA